MHVLSSPVVYSLALEGRFRTRPHMVKISKPSMSTILPLHEALPPSSTTDAWRNTLRSCSICSASDKSLVRHN